MDSEEKELLERVAKLSEDNNRMLRKLYSAMRWGRAWRIFYWVLIIGASIGAFYFIQPYVEQLLNTYSTLQNSSVIDLFQNQN